jgi:Rrf2 family iron-sulfur cluster assembly transcriptional regulator
LKLELTRRGDYAVRAMLALAEGGEQARLTAPQIAARMLIPATFLPQVMADLSRAGLVRRRLGRIGGYGLARPAEEISLLEVIETIEGDSRRRTCVLRNGPCSVDGRCIAHDTFSAAQEALRDSLGAASLASIVRGAAARPVVTEGSAAAPDPG